MAVDPIRLETPPAESSSQAAARYAQRAQLVRETPQDPNPVAPTGPRQEEDVGMTPFRGTTAREGTPARERVTATPASALPIPPVPRPEEPPTVQTSAREVRAESAPLPQIGGPTPRGGDALVQARPRAAAQPPLAEVRTVVTRGEAQVPTQPNTQARNRTTDLLESTFGSESSPSSGSSLRSRNRRPRRRENRRSETPSSGVSRLEGTMTRLTQQLEVTAATMAALQGTRNQPPTIAQEPIVVPSDEEDHVRQPQVRQPTTRHVSPRQPRERRSDPSERQREDRRRDQDRPARAAGSSEEASQRGTLTREAREGRPREAESIQVKKPDLPRPGEPGAPILGRGKSWRSFVEEYESVREFGRLSERQKIEYSIDYVEAKDRVIAREAIREATTWEDAKKQLRKYFASEKPEVRKEDLLKDHLYDEGMSFDYHLTNFKLMWDLLVEEGQVIEAEKGELFILTLPSIVRKDVVRVDTSDFEEVKRAAREEIEAVKKSNRIAWKHVNYRYLQMDKEYVSHSMKAVPPAPHLTGILTEAEKQKPATAPRSAAPKSPTDMRCIYCDSTEHLKRDCDYLEEDIKDGKVTIVNGRVMCKGMQPKANPGRGGIRAEVIKLTRPATKEGNAGLVTLSQNGLYAECDLVDQKYGISVSALQGNLNPTPTRTFVKPAATQVSQPPSRTRSPEPLVDPEQILREEAPHMVPGDFLRFQDRGTMTEKKSRGPPRVKLMTPLEYEESESTKRIVNQILDTQVTIPAREALACAPSVTAALHEMTGRKKYPLQGATPPPREIKIEGSTAPADDDQGQINAQRIDEGDGIRSGGAGRICMEGKKFYGRPTVQRTPDRPDSPPPRGGTACNAISISAIDVNPLSMSTTSSNEYAHLGWQPMVDVPGIPQYTRPIAISAIPIINVLIEGISFKALVDGGSMVNSIPRWVAARANVPVIESNSCAVTMADGTRVTQRGQALGVKVELGGIGARIPFLVSMDANHEAILGRPWIRMMRACDWTDDYGNGWIRIHAIPPQRGMVIVRTTNPFGTGNAVAGESQHDLMNARAMYEHMPNEPPMTRTEESLPAPQYEESARVMSQRAFLRHPYGELGNS